jgi:hypothetical protein
MRHNINISKSQNDFLELIIHEDAAKNISGAVQWCIDACQRIEKLYGTDACDISFNDIRIPDLPSAEEVLKAGEEYEKEHPNRFFSRNEVMGILEQYENSVDHLAPPFPTDWFQTNYPTK